MKDIGLQVATKREARMLKVKEVCEETILDNDIDTMIKKHIIELLNKEIDKEVKNRNK